MKGFFQVVTPEDVFRLIEDFPVTSTEEIPFHEAVGRILAQPVFATESIPPYDRSTMDGYAVRARDTFGASESLPNFLTVKGKVRMGEFPVEGLLPGEALQITTGGVLPQDSDAVVMQEYTEQIDETGLEVAKSVAPGENVIHAGEDFNKGDVLLLQGTKLRPQDIGMMAAIGVTRVDVHRRPLIAVISTGDEIVRVEDDPAPGKIRDINAHALSAGIMENGGIPLYAGIAPDRFDEIRAKTEEAMDKADMLLLSGGSSVGSRDFTLRVFASFPGSSILVQGIAVSPGKPTILARIGNKALWGLPGHPASSLIVFWLFVRRMIRHVSGFRSRSIEPPQIITARLSRNVASAQGREDYVRVRLSRTEDGYFAAPVFGKSGLISTLVKADGVIRIDLYTEGLDAGTLVDVYLF
ncbi:MAG: gephyrin-like molybdotransferase Glp [Pseudomonadota bacterium]